MTRGEENLELILVLPVELVICRRPRQNVTNDVFLNFCHPIYLPGKLKTSLPSSSINQILLLFVQMPTLFSKKPSLVSYLQVHNVTSCFHATHLPFCLSQKPKAHSPQNPRVHTIFPHIYSPSINLSFPVRNPPAYPSHARFICFFSFSAIVVHSCTDAGIPEC